MSTQTISHLRDSALGLAAEGLSVIPVRLEFDGHKVNKKPAVDWKPYQTTIADPETIAAWFADPSVNGIGWLSARPPGKLGSISMWWMLRPSIGLRPRNILMSY